MPRHERINAFFEMRKVTYPTIPYSQSESKERKKYGGHIY
jgi:hypothetical protein